MKVCNLVGSAKLPLMTTGLKLIMPENIPFQLSPGCVLVLSSGKNKNKYSNGKFSVSIH
jgi:hydrogenase maturation factor